MSEGVEWNDARPSEGGRGTLPGLGVRFLGRGSASGGPFESILQHGVVPERGFLRSPSTVAAREALVVGFADVAAAEHVGGMRVFGVESSECVVWYGMVWCGVEWYGIVW